MASVYRGTWNNRQNYVSSPHFPVEEDDHRRFVIARRTPRRRYFRGLTRLRRDALTGTSVSVCHRLRLRHVHCESRSMRITLIFRVVPNAVAFFCFVFVGLCIPVLIFSPAPKFVNVHMFPNYFDH